MEAPPRPRSLFEPPHRTAEPASLGLHAAVYDELRRLARHYLRGERPDHTLGPTALVHEAWLKLSSRSDGWHNRDHFLAAAAKAMRRILVNHAKRRRRLKRGGDRRRVVLHDAITQPPDSPETLLALDDALCRLERLDARKVRVVELRYFAGLTVDETARVIGASPATVKRDWTLARTWLLRDITGEADA